MTGRAFNFSPGPAGLPTEVLERARAELLDYRGSGVSVMEMSHRGPLFMGLAEKVESDLRALLSIPDDYAVVFQQGGATLQFHALVWNLLGGPRPDTRADYAITGHWSRKAQQLGATLCDARIVCDAAAFEYARAHDPADWDCDPGAAFLHYCPNETIHGLELPGIPDSGGVPLVADFSSSILSEPLDVSRFSVIYAGAQKNIGPSGITLVICKREQVSALDPTLPPVLSWSEQWASDSMLNTPPTFAWYLVGLTLEWLIEQGGLVAIADINRQKAELLYGAIDRSNFYNCPVEANWRSRMNAVFHLADPDRQSAFLEGAEAAGLRALKGHRALGGLRASLYNAVPLAAVEALVDYMAEFERSSA